MKKFKKLSIVLVLAIVATLFAGCGNPIESISFAEAEAKTNVEKTYQIEYTITPADIENPKITWKSSDNGIATVDENGLVTGVGEGEVEITATAKKNVSATIKLTVGPRFCDETDEIKIDGLLVDESYKDKDSSSNKLLYMYYTIKSPESNIKVAAKGTEMTINGGNTYKSERITVNAEANEFTRNYYFSDYYKNVNVGEELKVMESFLIPAAELEKGKSIAFSNIGYAELKTESSLAMDTDSVQFFKNGRELAKKVDPEGYKSEVAKRKKASDSKVKKVRGYLNGYYYTFYVDNLSYKIEFSSPNKFTITSGIGGAKISNNGTYDVREGYIYMNFKGMDEKNTKKVPYEIKNGDIDPDFVSAYGVKG